jgi:hypothetical protein
MVVLQVDPGPYPAMGRMGISVGILLVSVVSVVSVGSVGSVVLLSAVLFVVLLSDVLFVVLLVSMQHFPVLVRVDKYPILILGYLLKCTTPSLKLPPNDPPLSQVLFIREVVCDAARLGIYVMEIYKN